jgi:Tfp pilus assembly protein PilO
MALGWRGQYLRYKDFFLNIAALYRQRADLRAFLEVILSIITVVIFLLFALKPTALTIIGLLQEIKEKQTTVVNLTQKISDLKTAHETFTKNQDAIEDIEISVSNLPKPDIIVQQIERIAIKNSVEILGVSIGQITLIGEPLKNDSTDNNMPISINIKGSYSNLLSFMKDVENLKIATKIDGINMNSSETETGQVIVVVITGKIPFLPN